LDNLTVFALRPAAEILIFGGEAQALVSFGFEVGGEIGDAGFEVVL